MQYTMYQGVQRTPYETVRRAVDRLPKRSWLPAGVASLMVLWIALLIANIMQELPSGIGAPTNRPPSSGTMAVSNSDDGISGSLVATSSNGSMDMSAPTSSSIALNTSMMMTNNTVNAPAPNTVASTATESVESVVNLPIEGGRGGDDGNVASPVVDTVAPVVTPVVDPVTKPLDSVVDTTPVTDAVDTVVTPITTPLKQTLQVTEPILPAVTDSLL